MRKALLLLIAAPFVTFAADPMFGTWKINLEKSKLANPAAWKGRVVIIESAGGDAYRTVTVTPAADSKTQRTEEIRYLDGKEHQRSTNPAETLVTRTIDDHHRILVFRRDGKEIGSIDSTISADGKVMTNVYKGVDANGKESQQLRV
jgi:hypothetical protein